MNIMMVSNKFLGNLLFPGGTSNPPKEFRGSTKAASDGSLTPAEVRALQMSFEDIGKSLGFEAVLKQERRARNLPI